MNYYKWRTIGEIGQWLGVFLFIIACIIMLIEATFVVEIVICIGSLLFTLSTKAKYYGRLLKVKRRRKQHLQKQLLVAKEF